ncbi:MAG: hypothetical protein AAFY26_22175 [Cyanobacteria bacterium J06638_22]
MRNTLIFWQHNRIAKFLEKILDAEIEKAGYPWEAFHETGQRTDRCDRPPSHALT